MAGFDTRFFDDFDNNTVDLQTLPGNGTITEPVGSQMVLSFAAGVHCAIEVGENPIAYEDIATYELQASGLFKFECRINGFTKTGNEILAGLTLLDDRNNQYVTGWYDANNDVYLQRMLGGVFTTRWQGAAGENNPNTTPHIYRLYINKTQRRVHVAEAGKWLEPWYIGFQYSINNGSTWVWPYTEELPFMPTKFGIYSRNWAGTYRGNDSSFDYLKFEQDPDPNVRIGYQGEGANDPQTAGIYEDDFSVRGTGGPPVSGDGIPKGQLMPGPPHQPEFYQKGPEEGGNYQDQLTRLGSGGADDYGTGPTMGHRLDDPGGQFEDLLLAEVVDADFLQEKADGDGNDLLYSGDVRGILPIDTTQGSFGTPVGNNHWGAAKDGKFYADGVECAPGGFGTLLGGWNHEAWRSSLEEPFQLNLNNGSMSIVSDDVVRLQMTAANGWPGGPQILSGMKWVLEAGDFDIQLDFANGSWTHADHALQFGITYNIGGSEGTNHVYVGRTRNRYEFMRIVNGAWANVGTGGGADASGKFRLTRVSGVYHAYYWTGSWVELGTGYTHPLGDQPVLVWLDVNGTSNVTLSFDVSNFTIASGTTTNRAGWYREASGAHRGTQQSMPDELLAICAGSSLDIIDPTNTKLWMRFLQGTNNVLGATASNVRVRRTAWSNGLLLVAYGNGPNDSVGGAAIVIDFTMDRVRWHRIDAAGETGGIYRGTGHRAVGSISVRNSATGGYSGDYSDWQIPDYRVHDVDQYRTPTEEFRVMATVAGMSAAKWVRWETQTDLEWSVSNETDHMLWCLLDQVSGELFYMDDTNMYSRNRTGAGQGWEDWMTGGTWTREYEKALPGTRTFDFQYHAARQGTFLFMPANEGVYRVNWPGGSWELFFGRAGSGATHEILPDYTLITGLAVGNDGSVDILIVAMENEARGQVVAIKIVDSTIYGRAEIVDLKVPSVVVA